MTLTATAQPLSPPRVLVELTTGSASVFSSIALYRDGVLTRTQPGSGVAAVAVYDYEASFGVPVVYRADVVIGGVTSTWTSTVVLLVDDLWFIHPSVPAFSFSASLDVNKVQLQETGAVTFASNATSHRILGSPLPVMTRSGQRTAASRKIVLQTGTEAEFSGLESLIRDDTPILVRFPPAWDAIFTEGWYAVGDVVATPLVERVDVHYHSWDMPMQRVAEPKLIVNELWSRAELTAAGVSRALLSTVWPTRYNLIIDDRR